MDKIRACLQDELSYKIYDAKMEFYNSRNIKQYTDIINSLPERIEWANRLLKKKSTKYSLFGAGEECKMIMKFISYYLENEPMCIYDNNSDLWGKCLNGVTICTPSDIVNSDELIVLATSMHKHEIYNQLKNLNISDDRLLVLDEKVLYEWNKKQYFDVFKPNENEIFIDGGAYDLMSSVYFAEWADGNYENIYAFEATEKYAEVSRRRMEQYKLKGEVIEKGLWNTTSTIYFLDTQGQGSRVVEHENDANIKIDVTSIDEYLEGKKVTFIKMDIEGSELQALIGAEQTIKKYKPRLAISVYHKPEDIIEIPRYIKELVPEYKFYIRTYGFGIQDDTVLYAYI